MEKHNIEKLLEELKAHDKNVYQRSIRKADIAKALAKVAGVDAELAASVAKVMDIGFLEFDPEFINFAGRYTDEMFSEMKTHVKRGVKLLQKAGVSQAIIEGVAYHHVNFDGKGYGPELLLEGQAIPVCARIARIADSIDAFINVRCYKQAGLVVDVVEDLKSFSGAYDPELVQRFERIHNCVLEECRRKGEEQPSPETYMAVLKGL